MKRPADEGVGLSVVGVAGLVGLVVGVELLKTSPIGASWTGAGHGITSQIGVTGPAAAVMLLSVAANILLGAAAMKAVRGRAFVSRGDAVLNGLAGAVLVDLVLFGVLGTFGLLRPPVLIALHAGGLVAVLLWSRPLVDRDGREREPILPAGRPLDTAAVWALVAAVWAAPVIVQLASPVVAIQDVLPNHVAPIEYLRQYGSYTHLDIVPAPNYGPSRQILGYVALVGALTVLSGLHGALATSAFVLPLTVVFAVSSSRFAARWLGARAGFWMLLTMPLTFSFLRLADGRGTVVAAPLLFLALTPEDSLSPKRMQAVAAIALGTLVYIHPLMGAMALVAYVALAVWSEPKISVAAPVAAVVLSSPQVLTMAGASLPSWSILAAAALAFGVVFVLTGLQLPVRRLAFAFVAVVAAAGLLAATTIADRTVGVAGELVRAYPLLTAAFAAVVVTRVCAKARPLALTGVAVAIVFAVGVTLLPQTSLVWRGIRDEVGGKTLQYWAPLFLATAAAGLLGALWEIGPGPGRMLVGRLSVAALVLVAALPIREGSVDSFQNTEHRFSEQLSVGLNKAQYGAWMRWPDGRLVIDAPRRRMVAALRTEQRRGRLGPRTQVLHLARDYNSWVATPLAVFTGTIETTLSLDPDRSPHALGGRLLHVSALARLLGPRYRYVVLEPAGLSPGIADEITASGYRVTFSNAQGEIFRRR